MKSIQTRLAFGLLLSLTLLLFAQWVVIASSIRKFSEQYIADRMLHTSDLLVAGVDKQPNNRYSLNTSRIDPIYSQAFSGYYYTLRIGDQKFSSRSLWDETLPDSSVAPGNTEIRRVAGPQHQLLLVLANAYQKHQQDIQVVVAENISSIEKDIDRLLVQHTALSLVVLIVLVSLQVFLVRKNLQPLEKIRRDLNKLETGQIDGLDENVPEEIVALVKELNTRIRAVQQRLQRSRRATGNLAHALKTPLTLLVQISESDELKSHPGLKESLKVHISSIRDIIDRELKRARVAGSSVGGKYAKLKPELQALVKSLEAMYRDKDIVIDYDVSENCPAMMEREDLHEMLGNVLDNACKWASGKILVSVSCEEGLRICVEDDGKGIPQEQTETILARGHRLDEQTEGHGLGLSIVKDIVDQYQGSMHMSRSEALGGLMTIIYIPEASGGN